MHSLNIASVILLLHNFQVIVEKVPKTTIPDIDKKKFLVPADLSGEFHVASRVQGSKWVSTVHTNFIRK